MQSSKLRGHDIEYDGSRWIYCDSGKPTAHNQRNCGYCGRADTVEGHDGCIGTLPGVMNACCGHGTDEDAYIQYRNGPYIYGRDAIKDFSLTCIGGTMGKDKLNHLGHIELLLVTNIGMALKLILLREELRTFVSRYKPQNTRRPPKGNITAIY